MSTGLFYHPIFLEHDTGWGHPERAQRLVAILDEIEKRKDLNNIETVSADKASTKDIQLNHSDSYIKLIQNTSEIKGIKHLDPDTAVCSKSYESALHACGAVLNAAKSVYEGIYRNAFALVRPPGHHALFSQAMGFCIFNNIAIAAKYLKNVMGLRKVVIIDWDAHHGNGTQDSFYNDPDVLYISLHQFPFYPGTGSANEIGTGIAKGFNVNIPMFAYSGENTYLLAIERIISPIVYQFSPEFILISAGYDGHYKDPLTQLLLTSNTFFRLSKAAIEMANEVCSGRIIFSLEGGYHLNGLSQSVIETLRAMVGHNDPVPYPSEELKERNSSREIEQIIEIQKRYWKL